VKLLWTGWSAFFGVDFVMIVGVLVEIVFCFVVLLMFVFLFEFEFGVNGVVGCFFSDFVSWFVLLSFHRGSLLFCGCFAYWFINVLFRILLFRFFICASCCVLS